MKYLSLFLLLLIIAFHTAYYTTLSVSAQESETMESDSYRLELEESTSTGEQYSEDSSEMVVPQIITREDKLFQDQGFIIKKDSTAIRLHIDRTVLDFDDIDVNTNQLRSTKIDVRSEPSLPHQLLMVKDTKFQTHNGINFPDTACDDTTICNTQFAQPWKLSNMSGVGYNLNGEDIPRDFVNKDYFRPFAEMGKNILISQKINPEGTETNELTVKIVTPPSQAEGSYNMVVSIIAIKQL